MIKKHSTKQRTIKQQKQDSVIRQSIISESNQSIISESNQSIISESNLKIYNDYIFSVSSILEINPPRIKFYFDFANKYDVIPQIRGRFFEDEYAIGFALNYNFKDEKDVLKTGKHEITEWLQYIITEQVLDRRIWLHSYDPIFKKLRRSVTKYYPQFPQKLAEYIKKQMLIYNECEKAAIM